MIIALLGALCSGKAAVAFYLQKEFGFVIVNLFEVFAKELDIEFTDEVYTKFYLSKFPETLEKKCWYHMLDSLITLKCRGECFSGRQDIRERACEDEGRLAS
jgi:deoxyadenosine/deoxycytidine kinase